LTDPDTKIRVASAYAVSKVAHNDWPEDWPNLFNVLLDLIKSSNPNDVHGAMRVLTELISNDITVEQFPQIAPVLCPQLLAILTNDSVSIDAAAAVNLPLSTPKTSLLQSSNTLCAHAAVLYLSSETVWKWCL
jgi:hypothetical protein